MEQLNRIELRGIIGTVRVTDFVGSKCARLSVATSLAYRDKDGSAVIESTWHSVVCFEGKDVCELESLEKGDKVHLVGRIRNQRCTDENGNSRMVTEVLASRLDKIDSAEPLQYEI